MNVSRIQYRTGIRDDFYPGSVIPVPVLVQDPAFIMFCCICKNHSLCAAWRRIRCGEPPTRGQGTRNGPIVLTGTTLLSSEKGRCCGAGAALFFYMLDQIPGVVPPHGLAHYICLQFSFAEPEPHNFSLAEVVAKICVP
jgi:hypothetical protein